MAAFQKRTDPEVKEKADERKTDVQLVGASESMQLLFHKLQKIAPTDANRLIFGENGTGKDLSFPSSLSYSLLM